MWSFKPRFSWITSTAPRGSAALAHAPCSVPFGPVKVISSVGSACSALGAGAVAGSVAAGAGAALGGAAGTGLPSVLAVGTGAAAGVDIAAPGSALGLPAPVLGSALV